jgi:hypothetical protein
MANSVNLAELEMTDEELSTIFGGTDGGGTEMVADAACAEQVIVEPSESIVM